jgi:hypothetical protein
VAQALQYRRRQDHARNETTQPSQASATNDATQVAEASAIGDQGVAAQNDPFAQLALLYPNTVASVASAPPAAIGSSDMQETDESKQGEHLDRDADYLSLLQALSRGAHQGNNNGHS